MTPLLFASLVVDDRGDDEARFVDQPKSSAKLAPEVDRRRSLLRLLQARPNLAAVVREFEHPAGHVDQFAPQFWSLVRTLRLANISDLASLPLPLARTVVLPIPFKLQRLAFTSRLSPIRAPLARLADWVDLASLTRLDISTSGEGHSLRHALEGAEMPHLVDLRVVTDQRRDDFAHVEAILRIHGGRLRTLQFFDLSGRRAHTPNIKLLCPGLKELGLDAFRMPPFGYPADPGTSVWALDRLLFGPPWINPADRPASEPILPPSERKPALAAVRHFRPLRLAFASLDAGSLSEVDRTVASDFVDVLRSETGDALVLEDRFGREIIGH